MDKKEAILVICNHFLNVCITRMTTKKYRLLYCLFLSLLLSPSLAKSQLTKSQQQINATQLISHDLQCGDVFSCPPELTRRIDFWIQVFRLWKIEDRIFHDARVPERVYSVVNTEDQCSRRRPKGEIKKELDRIQSQLATIADQLENGVDLEIVRSLPMADLFTELSPQELRDAADNVRCQSGNRERFHTALENFELYRPFIVQALTKQSLSHELQYLPFVESAFNPRAYSHAGAAGLWQIMPRTARSLGLQVGASVDERFEPELATLAAAKYFRNSTDKLTAAAIAVNASTAARDLNPFIVTSYNYGVRGMERAIAQVGTDYMKLLAEYKSNSFRTAVRNFYASFLAARHVAQNAIVYFPNSVSKEAQKAQGISIKKAVRMKQIEKILNVKRPLLRSLNPALTSRVWQGTHPIPAGYVLKVPVRNDNWLSQIDRIDKLPVLAGGDSGQRYRVRKGQTACGIANKYRVKCRDLVVLNKLNRKAVIRVGQQLKIPTSGREKYRPSKLIKHKINKKVLNEGEKEQAQIATNDSSQTKQSKSKDDSEMPASDAQIHYPLNLHETSKGLTLYVLASETLGHYTDWIGKGSPADIRRINGMKKFDRLSFGQLVKMPNMLESEKETFEAQREVFHEAIASQYFQRFKINKTHRHRIRRGETLWKITQNAGIPLWLLHNTNPAMKNVLVGEFLLIPEVDKI